MRLSINESQVQYMKEKSKLILYSNKHIAIIKPYNRHSISRCTQDLLYTFKPLGEGLLKVIQFPFMFIRGLLYFLPIVRFIKNKPIKVADKWQ